MKKILLVDDNAEVLALLGATLAGDTRYTILVAHDGADAVEVAIRERPDLILLDVLMPALNGFEVCVALKANPTLASTKIVMLTAQSQNYDRARGLAVGADGYFTKPFSPAALLDQIESIVGG